jgi:hypothetical protein
MQCFGIQCLLFFWQIIPLSTAPDDCPCMKIMGIYLFSTGILYLDLPNTIFCPHMDLIYAKNWHMYCSILSKNIKGNLRITL